AARQGGSQVHCRCGLTDSTLLVGNREHPSFFRERENRCGQRLASSREFRDLAGQGSVLIVVARSVRGVIVAGRLVGMFHVKPLGGGGVDRKSVVEGEGGETVVGGLRVVRRRVNAAE